MLVCKVALSLFSSVNQSAHSALDWVQPWLMNSQSGFDWVAYKHHWKFPNEWEDNSNVNMPFSWLRIQNCKQSGSFTVAENVINPSISWWKGLHWVESIEISAGLIWNYLRLGGQLWLLAVCMYLRCQILDCFDISCSI